MSETSRLPTLDDFADAEHCVLEDVTVELPALTEAPGDSSSEPRKLNQRILIRDKLRSRQTIVGLYAEGWADIVVRRRGRQTARQRIDLRFLDPVPSTSRHHPARLLKTAGILAGVTGVCALPVMFGWFLSWSLPVLGLGLTATLGTLFVSFYLSHEKIVFRTLHGRAGAIRFGAGLGTIRRFRKLIPELVEAIADAAESVHDETAVYLRAEMREHYRLRNDGILSEDECAASTGRILGEFDGPL